MKLKTDVLTSANDGLLSEKEHLTVELRETRELSKSYENKCSELILQLNSVQSEYQNIKKRMIGSDELAREREERIEKFKTLIQEQKVSLEKLEIEHGTLKINHEKVSEQFANSSRDLIDTVEKLHLTNKVRHETEVKLGEEAEKSRNLLEICRLKEETL
jgi:chromosome segregation ATPase